MDESTMQIKNCRICDVELTTENCPPWLLKSHGYICRVCDRVQHQQARTNKPEQYREYKRQYRQNNPEQKHQSDIAYRKRNREKIRAKNKIYYRENIEQYAKIRLAWGLALKQEVMTVYSKGVPQCVRCGYSDIRALSIDHINGKGSVHRRMINNTTYRWLKKQGFPEGYQVLCMNCQFIKRIENREHGTKQLTAMHLPDIPL